MKLKYALSILLFLTIFGLLLSDSVFAQTPTFTEALIIKLQEQIKALQEQVTKLQAEVSSTKTELEAVKIELKFTKALSRGAIGDEVKRLQEFLKQFPDIYPQGLVTGYFGPLTEAAIRKFQEKNDIESIGVVGPKTLSKLNELVTEGAGASGVVPPGLLIAPGIEKKVETTPSIGSGQATTTPVAITPVTPTPAQPVIAIPTGVCLIKDRYTDIPRFDIADFGNGFGKYAVSGVNAVAELKTSCTKTIYDYLLQNYCKSNGNPVQRLIMTYGATGIGEANSLNCGALGCDFVDCSSVASLATIATPTTTPSGTTPATPATPAISATPATPTSVSASPTVSATPAISATPATPATTASTTTTATAVTISSVSATFTSQSIVPSSAQITFTWNTDVPADSQVEYTKTDVYSGGTSSNELVYSHSIVLYLAFSTTYKYKVKSMANGVLATSAEFTITTPATTVVTDTTPPVISNLRAENITTSEAQIKWTTSERADSMALWSLSNPLTLMPITTSQIDCTTNTDNFALSIDLDHCVKFIGLSSGTTYYYQARSKDAWINYGSSSIQQFTTTATAATTGTLSFSKSSFSATYIQGTPLPSTPDSLTFTNTSNINVNYTISVPNKPAWLNSGYATQQLTATPGLVTGLGAYLDPTTVAATPGTYTTNIIISGNFSDSPKTIPVTLTVIASVSVPQVQGLTATVSGSSVTLSWAAVTVSTGNITYNIYIGTTPDSIPYPSINFAGTMGLSYTHVNRPAGTYYYKVAAKDYLNNIIGPASSAVQAIVTATSTSSLDTRSKNLAAISKMINSLNEILEKLSQLLK